VIGPYLVQAIGPRWARRYFLTAEAFDAREAERIGLVHGVFKLDQLDLAVNQICDILVANGPKALADGKDMLRFVARGPIDDAMIAETAARIARIRVTQEGREGIASFLEKRKPNWRS
jgi:methylglutaconyl-CoA hydratase